MVLNNPPAKQGHDREGFCYRCVFPKPPPPESVATCGEGGILGPVVGVMGTLMAVEAIKLLVSTTKTAEAQTTAPKYDEPSILMYSAYSNPSFRTIKLSGKRRGCVACSAAASITRESLESESLDYVAFCGGPVKYDVLPAHERMSASRCKYLCEAGGNDHVLVDVREKVQFDIAHIDGSINLPFSDINANPDASLDSLARTLSYNQKLRDYTQLHLICRFGNDSQLAFQKIKKLSRFSEREGFLKYAIFNADDTYVIRGDIKGGLDAWRKEVDNDLPDY